MLAKVSNKLSSMKCFLPFISAVSLFGCGDREPSAEEEPVFCRISSDCPFGLRCVEGLCAERLSVEGCELNSDCPPGLLCDSQARRCVELECLSDRACLPGQRCRRGACVTDAEADFDRDGIPDVLDLCPRISDPEQRDQDQDGVGDACDQDRDGDGVVDALDNCLEVYNPLQGDANGDGEGNACDLEVSSIKIKGRLNAASFGHPELSEAIIYLNRGLEGFEVNADGSFSISHVIKEPGVLNLYASWYPIAELETFVTVPDGELEFDLGTLRLESVRDSAAMVELSGVVRLSDRLTAGLVNVRAYYQEALIMGAVTTEEGAYQLRLPRSPVNLVFSREGYRSQRVELSYEQEDESQGRFVFNRREFSESPITLEPMISSAEITITWLNSWIPQSQRTLELNLIHEGVTRRVSLTGSTIALDDLPIGWYEYRVRRAGFAPLNGRFNLTEEGGSLSLEMSVERLSASDLDLTGLTLSSEDLRLIPDLVGANLGGLDLQGIDLCGLDLSAVNLQGANLSGADLSGVDLEGARLDNARLVGVNFVGARLIETSLFGANLSQALLHSGAPSCLQEYRRTDLSGAHLSDSLLQGTIFTAPSAEELNEALVEPCLHEERSAPLIRLVDWGRVNLSEARMRRLKIEDSDLSNVSLARANLSESCLTNLSMGQVDLTDTELSGSELNQVWISSSVMSGTRLNSAKLSDCRLSNLDLNGVILSRSEISYTDLSFVDATSVNLSDTRLDHLNWWGALLTDLHLNRALLTEVNLFGSRFSDSNFEGAHFIDSELNSTELIGADLSSISLERVGLVGANLSKAMLEGLDLSQVSLLNTDLRLARYDEETQWPVGFDPKIQRAIGPGSDLSGMIFPILFDATLANLRGADLSETVMEGVNLQGADLSLAVLSGATMRSVDLSFANLSDAQLFNINVSDSLFDEAQLQRSRWSGISEEEILAEEGSSRSRNDWGILSGCSFREAQIDEALFSNLQMSDNDFTGVSDQRARFDQLAQCPELPPPNSLCVELSPKGALLDHTGCGAESHSFPLYALISPTLLAPKGITGSLEGLDLTGINLSGASFDAAYTHGLLGCPLLAAPEVECVSQSSEGETPLFALLGSRVIVRNVTLGGELGDGLDVSGADLSGSDLSNLTIHRLSLEDACLESTDFGEVDTGEVKINLQTVCPEEGQHPGDRCGGRFPPPCLGACPDLDWVEVTSPEGEVRSHPYALTRSEITIGQYRACVDAGICTPPIRGDVYFTNIAYPISFWTDEVGTHENDAVSTLSWTQLNLFAAWVGARLPTEAELSYASSSIAIDFSPPGLLYCSEANVAHNYYEPIRENVLRFTELERNEPCADLEVCACSASNTGDGICDLIGNTFEWTQDVWSEEEPHLVDLLVGRCDGPCATNATHPQFSRLQRSQHVMWGHDRFSLIGPIRRTATSELNEWSIGGRLAKDL